MRILRDPAGGGGGGTPNPPTDWKSALPPELLANPVLASFKDPVELAKSWDSAQKLIGAKRIALPGEKATDQEREEFYKAIGRPESLDKYSDPTVKPIEGLTVDQEGLKKAREQFFKLGLTDSQQRGLMDFYLGGLNESHQKLAKDLDMSKASAESALREEWKDRFDANMGVVNSVIKHFGDETLADELKGQLGNNVGLIRLLHKFGVTLSEDKAIQHKFTLDPNSPAAAQAKIAELKGDKAFQEALNNPRDPGHKNAVELWVTIHRQLG